MVEILKMGKWSHIKLHNSAKSYIKLENYMRYKHRRSRFFEWDQPEFCSFARLEMRAYRNWQKLYVAEVIKMGK